MPNVDVKQTVCRWQSKEPASVAEQYHTMSISCVRLTPSYLSSEDIQSGSNQFPRMFPLPSTGTAPMFEHVACSLFLHVDHWGL